MRIKATFAEGKFGKIIARKGNSQPCNILAFGTFDAQKQEKKTQTNTRNTMTTIKIAITITITITTTTTTTTTTVIRLN